MSYSRLAQAGLFAVALSACAHTNSETSTTLSHVRVESYQATGASASGGQLASVTATDRPARFSDRIPSADAAYVSSPLVVTFNECKTWSADDALRCDVADYQIQSYDRH